MAVVATELDLMVQRVRGVQSVQANRIATSWHGWQKPEIRRSCRNK